MSEQKSKRSLLTEWLEKMQQESWQLELLISGLALYGILESRSLLEEVSIFVDQRTFGTTGFLGGLMEWFVNIAWTIGAINLFAHIFLRGLWIGAIGLRYVSGDIDFTKLGYSRYFQELFSRRIGSYDDFIERLEKVCSTIFAYTFLLFFLFLSIILFLIPMGLPILLFDIDPVEYPQAFFMYTLVALIYMVLGLIVFIDFITGGVFKKVKDRGFSKAYGLLYRLFAFITLSTIYRPILYNFLDNRYGRRWFYFSLPYILFVALVLPTLSFSSLSYFPDRKEGMTAGVYISDCSYDDLRTTALAQRDLPGSSVDCAGDMISLQAFRVKGDLLEFFIPMRLSDHRRFLENDSIYPLHERGINSGMNIKTSRQAHRKDDENEREAEIRLDYEQKRDSIIELRKEVTSYKNNDSIKSAYYDDILGTLRNDYDDALKAHLEENMGRIRSALVDQYSLQVDGRGIDKDITSYFYIHPYRHTNGLKCIVPIDGLEKGMHEFSYRLRKRGLTVRFNKRGTTTRENYSEERMFLPFLKLDGVMYPDSIQ